MGHTVGWAGSYQVTPPEELGWWVGSTGHYEDNTVRVCRPVIGSDPTRISGDLGKVFVGLSGDVAFQTAHHLSGRKAFATAPVHISAGLVVG